MRQIVFAYVSIQGWVIDPYKHWFFYQPGEVLLLPAHYAKVFKCASMICDVTVVMNWGGGFQMFFKPLSKCSSCLSYVLITFQSITFESVDHATLFCYVVFIFRCHLFIFYGLSTLEMYLYAIFYICSWNSHSWNSHSQLHMFIWHSANEPNKALAHSCLVE